ncbi:MAG: hypothetical protein ABL940_11710 [Bacteroidia bacterium]
MKSNQIIVFTFFIALAIVAIESCKKETKISSTGKTKSHNIGKNCMDCHKKRGDGEGIFTAAGTVYDSVKTNVLPNVTLKLFTGPNGTGDVKYTIPVDGLGNFYTTETISYGSGLYPAIVGATTTKFMISSITTGQCNGCHGVTTAKIWAKQ